MSWSFASARRLCLLALLASACADPAEDPTSVRPAVSPLTAGSPARSATERLNHWKRLAGPDRPLLTRRDADGALTAAAGLHLPLPGHDPEALARQMRLEAGPLLALDEASSLLLLRDATAPAGTRHLRFVQHRAGLPVFNARLELHLEADRLTAFNSSLVRLDNLRLDAWLDAAAASALLLEEGLQADAGSAGAFIVATGHGKGERAWRFIAQPRTAGGLEGPQEVLVSAVDGRILRRNPLQLEVSAAAPCQTSSQYDCMVRTTGTGVDGTQYEIDLFRGDGFARPVLYDGYGHPYTEATYPDLFADSSPDDTFFVDLTDPASLAALYVVDSDGSITDAEEIFFYDEDDHYTYGPGPTFDDPAYSPSVSAIASIRRALEYFHDRHGRAGMSDDPSAPVSIVARVGLRGLNAAWVSEMNYMIFGTWGGTSVAIGEDVTGHELTHGVNFFSSRLGSTDQSGALNEALADIFGTLIEAERNGEVDWWIGEDIPHLIPLRNLAHPEWYGKPAHMSEYLETESDNGGIHTNMSIVSKAFQLAVDGTPPGELYHGYMVTAPHPVRLEAAGLVSRPLYAALAYHLTPESTFADFAISALAAVDELDFSAEDANRVYAALRDAFLATGILTGAEGAPDAILTGTIRDTGSSEPIAGASVMLTWGGSSLQTETDALGNYRLKYPLEASVSATVTAAAYGYYSSTEQVTLAPLTGLTQTQLDRDLELAARPAASLRYTPPSAPIQVKAGGSTTFQVSFSNGGAADSQLVYSLRPTVDYSWSEIPFEWEDVLNDGSIIAVTGDQSHSEEMALGLSFPFYFGTFSSFYVSTDGYITLTADPTLYYRDYPIPSSSAPPQLIAPYWTDLDFGRAERAWFYHDASRQISYVQFQEVPDYMGDYFYTFQIVLYPDGRMRFQYLYVPATSASYARVGIQDGRGEEGLEVAFNRPEAETGIPHSRFGMEITPSIPPFADTVQVAQSEGVLAGGKSVSIPVTVSAAGLAKGTYRFRLRLETNEPGQAVRKDEVTVVVQ